MRVALAAVAAAVIAIGMTWLLFSIPAVATALAEYDMLLAIWFVTTTSCAMIVFALVAGII